MIDMLKSVMKKVAKIYQHMGNASREMEILRMNQKKIENIITEIKTTWLGMAKQSRAGR